MFLVLSPQRTALPIGHQESRDDLYLDSVALNLHNFYNGVERLFDGIATTLDNRLPNGSGWHKALLNQMTVEVSGLRPAVISDSTRTLLDNYCQFRHLVRSIYSHRINPDKLRPLIEEAPLAIFSNSIGTDGLCELASEVLEPFASSVTFV